jgi:hypothetical protein
MNEGTLISCPNCANLGKKQILGRVLDNGDLIVLRFHHGTTICRSENYTLACGCGFAVSIAGTSITNL